MKQEVVQKFLHLPGVTGIALMDGRSRPFFCGVDQALNFQQREALAQGILQVIETIPDGFDLFEFQFIGYQVHIYKLHHGIVLLVLTHRDLVYAEYLKIIKDLKATLQEDITNAIATFRLIAGNITLSGINYHKPDPAETETINADILPPLREPLTLVNPNPKPPAVIPPSASISPVTTHSTENTPTIKEIITALNQLSQFTTQYLGAHVITNYWKSTRPAHDWLNHFEVERSAQFCFNHPTISNLQHPIAPQEHEWIQAWVAAFIKRCAAVIRNFPTLVQQQALTPEQKALLFG
jgi:hypothetical protein